MKNLIGLLIFLLIGASSFGQINYFQNPPQFEIGFGFEDAYTFENNGEVYILSYEKIKDDDLKYYGKNYSMRPLNGKKDQIERNIYLFRNSGNNWVIASDIIKTDFWKVNNDVVSYERCYPYLTDLNELFPNIGKSYIMILDDGTIEIRLLSFYGKSNEINYRWDEIKLIPNGKEGYKVKK